MSQSHRQHYKISFNESKMKEIVHYYSESPCEVKKDGSILGYLEYIAFLKSLALQSKRSAKKSKSPIKSEHIYTIGQELLLKFAR